MLDWLWSRYFGCICASFYLFCISFSFVSKAASSMRTISNFHQNENVLSTTYLIHGFLEFPVLFDEIFCSHWVPLKSTTCLDVNFLGCGMKRRRPELNLGLWAVCGGSQELVRQTATSVPIEWFYVDTVFSLAEMYRYVDTLGWFDYIRKDYSLWEH
jgi:hypothetical protein